MEYSIEGNFFLIAYPAVVAIYLLRRNSLGDRIAKYTGNGLWWRVLFSLSLGVFLYVPFYLFTEADFLINFAEMESTRMNYSSGIVQEFVPKNKLIVLGDQSVYGCDNRNSASCFKGLLKNAELMKNKKFLVGQYAKIGWKDVNSQGIIYSLDVNGRSYITEHMTSVRLKLEYENAKKRIAPLSIVLVLGFVFLAIF